MIVAKTLKGKGVSFIEDKDGWHGKALKKGEELDRAVAELERQIVPGVRAPAIPKPAASDRPTPRFDASSLPPPAYARGDSVATREAYGTALAALGARPARRRARRRRQELDLQRAVREGAPGTLLSDVHRRAGHGGSGDGPRRARRDSVSVDVRLLPVARGRFHPHAGHLEPEREARRLARRRVDRRGRPVADGARGPGDDARRAELHGAVSVRRHERRAAGGTRRVSPGAGLHQDVASEDSGDLRRVGALSRRRLEDASFEQGGRGDRRRGGHHRLRGVESARRAEARRRLDPRHRRLLGSADRCADASRVCARDEPHGPHGRGPLHPRRSRRRRERGGRPGRHQRPPARRPGDPAKRQARGARRSVRHLGPRDRRGRPAGDGDGSHSNPDPPPCAASSFRSRRQCSSRRVRRAAARARASRRGRPTENASPSPGWIASGRSRPTAATPDPSTPLGASPSTVLGAGRSTPGDSPSANRPGRPTGAASRTRRIARAPSTSTRRRSTAERRLA